MTGSMDEMIRSHGAPALPADALDALAVAA